MIVVFDIGGVIFDDIWENLFLDPENGLRTKFNLDFKRVNSVCRNEWDSFAIKNSINNRWVDVEYEYWTNITHRLAIDWPVENCIEYSKKFINKKPGVSEIIELLTESGINIGICSNQTAFWFNRQLNVSSALSLIDRKNMALSFERGVPKGENNNQLFRHLLSSFKCSASDIIYIEDRIKYQNIAKEFGFNLIPVEEDDNEISINIINRLKQFGISL